MDDFYFDEEENHSEGSFDFTRYWKAIINKWWLWSATTLIVSVPWVLYVKKEKPVYETTAVIQFQTYSGGIDPTLFDLRNQKLMSRTFAEEIVRELGLVLEIDNDDDAEKRIFRQDVFSFFSTSENPVTGKYSLRFPSNGTFALYKLPDDDDGREEKLLDGQVFGSRDTLEVNGFYFSFSDDVSALPREVNFTIHNFRRTVQAFRERIRVNYGGAGTIMEVTLQDNDPYLASRKTNKLAEIFVRESKASDTNITSKRLSIYEERLQRAEKNLKESSDELKRFRDRYGIDLDSQYKRHSEELKEAEDELETYEEFNAALNNLLKQAKSEAAHADEGGGQISDEQRTIYNQILGLKIFEDNVSASLLRTRIAKLEEDYDKKTVNTKFSEKAIELAGKLRKEYADVRALAQKTIRENNVEIRKLRAKIRKIKNSLKQQPAVLAQLDELERKNETLQDLYQAALSDYENARLSTEGETQKITILDRALPPDLPVNSNKKTRAAIGVIAGFMLGIIITLGIEFLDKSLKTVEDVRRNLRINVLGTIPEIDFSEIGDVQDQEKAKIIDNQIVTHDYSPTPIGEAYRSLRTSIMFSKSVGRIQSLVITSMAPGDGKSFTAANLAITMAQQKSNTLLVDTDLRRGVLHNTFGVPKEPGFSTYLTSNLPVAEIINETHIPNLSVVSCGALIPNPSELLGSHQMKRFLDEVRRRFDLIIFDTPPLNAATDAVVVGTQVDATVIVVRAGKTHRDMARQKMELYQHVPAKVIGVILNGVSTDLAHEGYSYYQY